METIMNKSLCICGCCKRCLLYTSDAADEEDSVHLGVPRTIKKKKQTTNKRNGGAKLKIKMIIYELRRNT